MPKLFPITILFLCVALTGSFSSGNAGRNVRPSPTPPTNEAPNVVNISFDKSGPILPCICDNRERTPEERTQLRVSTLVENKTGDPVTYIYKVSGGRIVGQGPRVIWDFLGLMPGEYSITATVDDGSGVTGTAVTKTVELRALDCQCRCECPSIVVYSHNTSVKRGDDVDFETRLQGGKLKDVTYNWVVSNGVIKSGQGTPAIIVSIDKKSPFRDVTATVEMGGTDPNCNCPNTASGTVPIGARTQVQEFALSVPSISLDETTLYYDCPPGLRRAKGSRVSKDMIIDVSAFARSNSILDRLEYSYQVTGGAITGSGADVQWDLTNVSPGTYYISVSVNDGRRTLESAKKQMVTVARADCPDVIQCPRLSLSRRRAAGKFGEFIVAADVSGGGFDAAQYIWSATGAEILAGQGTQSIRIRTNADTSEPVVTFKLEMPEEFSVCPNTESVTIQRSPE